MGFNGICGDLNGVCMVIEWDMNHGIYHLLQ